MAIAINTVDKNRYITNNHYLHQIDNLLKLKQPELCISIADVVYIYNKLLYHCHGPNKKKLNDNFSLFFRFNLFDTSRKGYKKKKNDGGNLT